MIEQKVMDPDQLEELYQLCPDVDYLYLYYKPENKTTNFDILSKFKNLTSLNISQGYQMKFIKNEDIIEYLSKLDEENIINHIFFQGTF